MKIKVHEAVGQKASASGERSGAEHRGRRHSGCAKVTKSVAIKQNDNPGRHSEACQSGVEQEFEVVVVGVIDQKTVERNAITRKRGGESPEAAAQKRMGGKHAERVAMDRQARRIVEIADAVADLFGGDPGQERRGYQAEEHKDRGGLPG